MNEAMQRGSLGKKSSQTGTEAEWVSGTGALRTLFSIPEVGRCFSSVRAGFTMDPSLEVVESTFLGGSVHLSYSIFAKPRWTPDRKGYPATV